MRNPGLLLPEGSGRQALNPFLRCCVRKNPSCQRSRRRNDRLLVEISLFAGPFLFIIVDRTKVGGQEKGVAQNIDLQTFMKIYVNF